jgi:hypothetical protein
MAGCGTSKPGHHYYFGTCMIDKSETRLYSPVWKLVLVGLQMFVQVECNGVDQLPYLMVENSLSSTIGR